MLARRDFAGKALVDAVLLLPLVLPPVVTGYVLLLLFGRRGLLGPVLAAAGIDVAGIHFGVCSACMIGPDHFAEFTLPALNRMGREFGPIKVHSCGLSDHLTDLFGGIEKLTCLNVGSHTSVARIRERLGNLRVDVIPDAQLLTCQTPDAVDRWVRRTVDENGDGRLEFQYHLDLLQPEENALQMGRTLRELGFDCPREPMF